MRTEQGSIDQGREEAGGGLHIGGRLKTLNGLTPYQAICKASTTEPQRFLRDPTLLISGLNT